MSQPTSAVNPTSGDVAALAAGSGEEAIVLVDLLCCQCADGPTASIDANPGTSAMLCCPTTPLGQR